MGLSGRPRGRGPHHIKLLALLLVGLVIGGNDVLESTERNKAESVTVEARAMAFTERATRLKGPAEITDARLIALANLQAQGRTPAALPIQSDTSTLDSWILDGGWYTNIEVRQTPSVGRAGVERIICARPWPQGCNYWIAIARCESALSPSAIGYRGAYVGLFQVWAGHDYGHSWLLDPSNNVQAAWELSDEGKYTGAWPHCQW